MDKDNLGALRSWIVEQIETVEETYGAPEELSHIDSNDFIEVMTFVKEHINEMVEYAYDEEDTDLG